MTHGGHQIKVGRAEASQGDLQRWCGRVTEIPGEKLFQVQDASGQTKDCKAIAQAGKGQDRPAFQTCPAPSCSQPTEQTSPCTAVPLGPSPQHVLQKHTLEQRPLLVRLPLPPTTRETELTPQLLVSSQAPLGKWDISGELRKTSFGRVGSEIQISGKGHLEDTLRLQPYLEAAASETHKPQMRCGNLPARGNVLAEVKARHVVQSQTKAQRPPMKGTDVFPMFKNSYARTSM